MDSVFLATDSLIEHRIGKWLPVGAAILTEERLASLEVPTVVIAGDDDNFLPSKSEAETPRENYPYL